MSVHVLDTLHLQRPHVVAATALETDEGVVLFDVGPEVTFATLRAALAEIGFDVEDVRHVFLSHIHFDHAGAAWRFAEAGATIHVHPRGAPHLLDPTKLISSATRIFGDQMPKLWGEIRPVPSDRLNVLADGAVVRVSPFEMRALATPGHASHHHVYHWDDSIFGGDVAGVRIGHGPPFPPFVPPELEIEEWVSSIARLRQLKAERLFLPHFGEFRGSLDEHFEQLEARVRSWADWFRDQLRSGASETELRERFAGRVGRELSEGGASGREAADYEAADPSFMAVAAATRYWQKFHPQEIEAD